MKAFENAKHGVNALGFAQVAKHRPEKALLGHSKLAAELMDLDGRDFRRRFPKVRDLINRDFGSVAADGFGGGGIVNDDRARPLAQPAEHGPIEVAGIGGRAGPVAVQFPGEAAMPFAVVVNELFDVLALGQAAQEEVLEQSGVEDDGAGAGEGALIDAGVQGVIADVIELGVTGADRVDFDGEMPPESRQKSGGVIRHARPGGRHRRVEAQGHGLTRLPKSAVPTRTWVAPSSIAVSRSWDMPIDRPGSESREASSRSWRK